MRRFAQFLTAAALAALASTAASAQNANAVTRADQTANAEARFKRLDGDGNGRFDRAEFIKVRDQAERATEARLKQVLAGEFTQLDSNKDQSITAAEIDAKVKIPDAGKKSIARLDKNKDGKISMAEYTSQSGVEATVDPDQIIRQWDSNGDKIVTREEFTATVLARFDSFDANKDGTVTAQEAAAKANSSAPAQGR